MEIEFQKYHGTGNDFIIFDNRNGNVELSEQQAKRLCDRHFGIGADGIMGLNRKEGYDFEMKYYNADGKEGSMCGNGARCLVKYASRLGIKRSAYRFTAFDGDHEAEIDDTGLVRLRMADVKKVRMTGNDFVLNTGSPHYVKCVADTGRVNVFNEGRAIRNNKEFAAEGINVNFVSRLEDDEISVRTYERGVEAETLSCGTGVTAAALISAHNDIGFNRVEITTPGGHLSVEFDKIDDNNFTNIWLCGPAELVFKGVISI